ncbi:hypothetical protein [Streptomyces genisteinicus]|uniref:hypothetical protein n=1 Tax=Streptomyces genisteinicus TaxID=2768068 RepID=UPI001FE759A5|nr:hypothetical protein [Streptomyces genisteinicus]
MTHAHPPHPHPAHGPLGGWAPPPVPPKPGVIPLAPPLGVGGVLGGAFATLGRHWKQLLGFTAAVYGGALALFAAALAAAYAVFAHDIQHLADTSESTRADDVWPLLAAFGGVYLTAGAVMLVAGALVHAACPAVLQDAVLGLPSSFRTLWRRALPRMWAVLGSLLISGLIAAVPLVLLVLTFFGMIFALLALVSDDGSGYGWLFLGGLLGVLLTGPPAVWLWVRFSLAPAAAVFEQQGVMRSLSRSAQLVRGSWWRVFGISMLAFLMAAVAAYLVQLPLQLMSLLPAGPASLSDGSSGGGAAVAAAVMLAFALLGALVGQAVTAVFPPLVLGLLYVDERMRKENLGPALAEAAGAHRT